MAEQSIRESVASLLALIGTWWRWLPLYVIAIGLIYQYGYWSSFEVQFMAYLGWQDVVRLSVPGLILGLFGFVLIFLETRFLETRERKSHSGFKANGLGVSIAGFGLAATSVVSVVLYAVWNSPPLLLVPVVALLAAIGATAILSTWNVTGGKFKAAVRRDALLLAFLAVPSFAWVAGAHKAEQVVDGVSFTRASLPITNPLWFDDVHAMSETRYLGHVNEFEFLLVKGTAFAVRSDAIPALALVHVRSSYVRPRRIPFRDAPLWRDRKATDGRD